MSDTSLTYAYAVARDRTPALVAEAGALTGVAGAPVHLLRSDRTTAPVAVVSPVPAEDFHEEALRRHLEDLGWLEVLARAHHGVIEALTACATLLPLRLATVYLDEDRVRAMLDHNQELFLDALARLDGHVELGVKLYIEAAPDTSAATTAPPEPALSPGRAYLRRRRSEQDARDDAHRAAEQAAERIAAVARSHAVQWARHRVQEGELATGPGQNVTNDAYLVPIAHAHAFREEVLRATDGFNGLRVEVTGPWAPYSFATLPEPGASTP
ncbi:GvpL/GvpF family gas vesicle protein [Kitasatospora sp. NPDC048545]|uniref:GvpL/GvpF family gas vesicle protein n=1 Tax=Kitasatospora sp. NPDC048545 TaxID=3157208 RepID=UPI0033CBEFB8